MPRKKVTDETVAEEKPKKTTRKTSAKTEPEPVPATEALPAKPRKTAAKKTTKNKTTAETPVESPVEKPKRAPRKKVANPTEEGTAELPHEANTSPVLEPASTSASKPLPCSTPTPISAEYADSSPASSATQPAPLPATELQTASIQRPRPLYISREVEMFLKAAGIPLPTEKAQLDAIIAAMQAAKIAAQQAAAAALGAAAPAAEAPSAPSTQPASAPQPQQPRLTREQRWQQREQQRREQREARLNREPTQHEGEGDAGGQIEGVPQPTTPDPRPDEPLVLVEAEGYCEISGKGFGFLRDPSRMFAANPADVFVTPEAVKRFGLRDGHWLKVEARKNSRGLQIHRVLTVNGQPPENAKTWPSYEDLTTISPIEHIKLETGPERPTTRVIDLLTPIGKGQRGLIVAPPRTGKTTLLNHIAEAVVRNHPDVHLIILLVDERPEEVTDFKRAIPKAELWASSNDQDVKSHTRIAQLAIERARRLVESGADVFLLLDSITRLGRAFNNAITGGGRTMSGGIDARALEMPRRIFAAARNTEEAGSLTIVATALIETGSRMDELIFQEFKGTGNCEIVLDRKISDQRVYPAIDIFQSGTRREELLLPADALHKINLIRRGLAGHKPLEAIERVLSFLRKFQSNEQLLREIPG